MTLSAHISRSSLGKLGLLFLATGLLSCSSSHQRVLMETGMGDIILEINTRDAPLTATNFLDLVDEGIYSDAVFYRVVRPDNQPHNKVKIEVIQGGLFDDALIDQHQCIRHESTDDSGILHREGVISMARNEPGSASTEFFICVGDQPELDFGGTRNPDGQGFATFGKVVEGLEVVKAIQLLPDSGQYLEEGVPILRVRRIL